MPSSFDDGAVVPDDAALSRTLGKAKKSWDAVVHHVDRLPHGLLRDWKFYGKKHGWQLKVTDRKRTVLYLIPHEAGFVAALALNEKAVATLPLQKIPPTLISEIKIAKADPEGRPARVEVASMRDVALVKRLLAIKLNT